MKNRLLIILLLAGILIASLFVVKHASKQTTVSETPVTNNPKTGKHILPIQYDLYYYRHPYLTRAHLWNGKEQYDSAIYYYKEAAEKFKREGKWESYVWVNGYIARLYLLVDGKDYRDAWPYLQTAMKEAGQYLGGQHPCTAITVFYMGMYYAAAQKADTALLLYNKAVAVLSSNGTEQNLYTSDIYEQIGKVEYNMKFDNAEAEKYYLKDIAAKEALPHTIKDSVLTSSYYNLIELYSFIRDYGNALAYCYKAMQYVPFVKTHKATWPELLEGTLANIYSEQQNYQEAIPRLQHAIGLNCTNKGDKGYLCFYYGALGDIYDQVFKYDSAIYFYKKALAAANDHSLFENQHLQIANEYYALGMTYAKMKNYAPALAYLNKCVAIRLKFYGNKHRETAVALQGIGHVYQQANLPDTALLFFQRAIAASSDGFGDSGMYAVPLVSGMNASFFSFLILIDKAAVLKQLYQKDTANINLLRTALAYYCAADTLITTFRSGYDLENAKLTFTKNNTGIYEEAIGCAALLYRITKNSRYCNQVFSFMDKRKAGLLLEALHEEQASVQAGISIHDQQAYHSLQQNLTYLQNLLEEENGRQHPDESTLQALSERTSSTQKKLRALKEKLSSRYVNYARIHPEQDTVTLKDLQLFSSRNNSLILEYFWGEKSVYVLGTYRNKNELVKVDKDSLMDSAIDSLRASLAKGYVVASKDKDLASFIESSGYVYNCLVKPVLERYNLQKENDVPGIIVIPDGPLSYISFEALLTNPASAKVADYRNLQYMIRKFTISYDYAAGLLLKNYQPHAEQRSRVLALGYSNDDSSTVYSGPLNMLRRDSYAELPGTVKEIRAVSSYMDGRFYMGKEATEDVFKKEAPYYDILHLAIHGQADNKNSYSSRLIFKKGFHSTNDGSLYAYEIYGMPLKARLVVLSACESGIGKFNSGEGMYSIARGFVYAGCPSIVMSLWKVNDYSTASIMAVFYQQLSTGAGVSQAIREAKLAYIDKADRRTAHPANWAAFAAMGNMTPVMRKSNPVHPILLCAGLLVAIGIMIFAATRRYKRNNKKN